MKKEIYQHLEDYEIRCLIVLKDVSSLSGNKITRQSIVENRADYLIIRVPDTEKKYFPYPYVAAISIDEFCRSAAGNQLGMITHLNFSKNVSNILTEDKRWPFLEHGTWPTFSHEQIIIPDEIWQLTNLSWLDLSHNYLNCLPDGLWHLHNLALLNLSYNQLNTLPNGFLQLGNLKLLDLSHNRLAAISVNVLQPANLEWLDLSDNQLATLPAEIEQLNNLTWLNLSHNPLTGLPAEIGQLRNLIGLDLDGKFLSDEPSLTSLPGTIGQLTNLTSLSLSGNELTDLPRELWQLANLAWLDLSDNKLTILPPEIGRLTNLTSLNVSSNELTSLPSEIGQLTKLTDFDVSFNELTFLPVEVGLLGNLTSLGLSNNELAILPTQIAPLTKLTSLNLSNNKLTVLPGEIGQFSELSYLNLSKNQLSILPPEIGRLNKLERLHISENHFKSLPLEIGELVNLILLSLSKNQLIYLPSEIGQLTNLRGLNLSSNRLRSLPTEIQNLKSLKKLDLRENAFDAPPEILGRVDEPKIILNYFAQILHGKKKTLKETKMLVVGQGSVGKTSLVKRLLNGAFDLEELKTPGISINHWHIKNQSEIILNIWDFGGQEIMHATHQFFLTKRSLYLLVLDSRLAQEENRVEYWLKIIQFFGGESPVLIVGNKIDQHPLDIDRTGLQKKYPNIVGILETSAATGAGIEELKAAISEHVNNLPHVHDLLPETWFIVKTKLEELGRQSNFIIHDRYLELCTQNEVTDETSQRTLIGFLHDLGVVLHFQDDPRLESLGILNPQWVTNGVYKILNSHTLFQNKGLLTVAMLDDILSLPDYPHGKRIFIVDMMKKFELCYDIGPDKIFLVPDLLPKDQPNLKFNGVPAFEYAYPVLPSSVITRFIVRMNQHIHDNSVWRTGVLLKIGNNTALIKADIEDRKITIAIDGLEHTRRDALSVIRYQLDEIHTSIKGLDVQKKVPVPNARQAEPLKYEYLLKLERAGQETLLVEDGDDLITVNIRQVLSAIESESQRKDNATKVTNIYVGGNVDGNMIIGDDNVSSKS